MSNEASASGFSLEGADNVEDFVWANEGDTVSRQRYSLLYDLMQMGNQAFHDNRFEEAISCYSRAHNIKPCHPVILSNRCAAYLRLCQFLVHRPPSDSEETPLSGFDPMIHARDAEKVMNFQNNSITAHILKADALILLERFELAHDIILLVLQVDPLR